eukprot:TRINITY_DN27570_c0_g1_i2.p1 TRINITY_DN27570_c0_g1~~TRINITY_DN27570_c0_g1_i2.p1  ORF type:complete len:333 (+),score=114.15 TRINITY_DN27570_c0_g1_i2:57-1055(+)
MNAEIKATMKRVAIVEFGKPLIVEEVPTPEPKEGEVLVKVAASPINPSDYASLIHEYPGASKVPGLEGSGVVVKSGGSEKGNSLVGKRVAILGSSVWAEYVVIHESHAFEISPETDIKKAACSFINPLTVVAMVRQVKKDGYKAVVHTVGASSLGRQLILSLEKEGVKTINIVRKQEQVEMLQKEFPFAVFLNSSAPDFDDQLKKTTAELNATVCFEAIGGDFTGRVLRGLPDRSVLYVYGHLSDDPSRGITADDLIFKGKKVQGFWLMNFFRTDAEFRASVPGVIYNLPTNLQSEVNKEFSFNQVNEAVAYMLANASKGKVILNPEIQQYI